MVELIKIIKPQNVKGGFLKMTVSKSGTIGFYDSDTIKRLNLSANRFACFGLDSDNNLRVKFVDTKNEDTFRLLSVGSGYALQSPHTQPIIDLIGLSDKTKVFEMVEDKKTNFLVVKDVTGLKK